MHGHGSHRVLHIELRQEGIGRKANGVNDGNAHGFQHILKTGGTAAGVHDDRQARTIGGLHDNIAHALLHRIVAGLHALGRPRRATAELVDALRNLQRYPGALQ